MMPWQARGDGPSDQIGLPPKRERSCDEGSRNLAQGADRGTKSRAQFRTWPGHHLYAEALEGVDAVPGEPGAPLDNTAAERVIKRTIMHWKNSLFYKTETGARIGDTSMSLIHTAKLNGAQ